MTAARLWGLWSCALAAAFFLSPQAEPFATSTLAVANCDAFDLGGICRLESHRTELQLWRAGAPL